MSHLLEQFGQIDIYLFDQILRGRIQPGMRILDAGCGGGRNLVYFLNQGYEVHAVDSQFVPLPPSAHFRQEQIESMTYPDHFADVVLSSAVLHFARDDAHFRNMLFGSWRVLKPGGLFFCRLASSIGMERQIQRLEGRRFWLPDGSERYLVDEQLLMDLTRELGGELLDPLKTSVVQNQRSMTTWVLVKQ